MRIPPLPIPARHTPQGWLADVPGRPLPVVGATLEELGQLAHLAARQAQHITEDGWVSLRLTPPDDVALDGPQASAAWLSEFVRETTGFSVRSTARALVVNERHEVLLFRREDPRFAEPVWYTPGGPTVEGSDHRAVLRDALLAEARLPDADVGPALWISALLHPIAEWDGSVDVVYLVRTYSEDCAPDLTATPLVAEGATEARWWSFDALRAGTERLSPESLPWYLDAVTRDEVPLRPPMFIVPPSQAVLAEHFDLQQDAFSG